MGVSVCDTASALRVPKRAASETADLGTTSPLQAPGMSLLLSWLFLAVGLYLTAKIVDGFEIRSFGGAIVVGAIFGVLHWLVGWLLFAVIGIMTLGLGLIFGFITRWIVTSILLKVTDALTSSLSIKDFKTAMIGGAILSVISLVRELIVR
jgi:putative membrane protein